MDILERQAALREFASERHWEQFHTPKNLVMALGSEVGELLEIFQWLTDQQSVEVMQDEAKRTQVRHKMADVYAYLLRLADVVGVDIAAAARAKLADSHRRFAVHEVHGTAPDKS